MAKKPLPTPEQLRQLLRYEPETGKLFWRERTPDMFTETSSEDGRWRRSAEWAANRWNSAHSGKEAFTALSYGYYVGTVLGRRVMAHRVCWAISVGAWPDILDHANGVPSDNRLENLRVATRSQNNQNVRSQRGSSSKYKGVTFDRSRGKWIAGIKKDFKRRNLGRFEREIDAAIAHDRAAIELYGEYARLNFPDQMPT